MNDVRKVRLEKLAKIRELGVNPYPDRFERTHSLSDAKNLAIGTKNVKIAGRLMTTRGMGKLTFAHLQDFSGRLQVVLQKEKIGEERYAFFADLIDNGDFIGCEGEIFQTKHGEISLLVESFVLLSKSLRPLPEKWHGVQNRELIYRERYLDLISNPDSLKRFQFRTNFIKEIRAYLEKNNFWEIDTPALCNKASGALAKPFITHHNALDTDVYLRIAPETYLKRAVVGGFERVFEFARCFRNEGVDPSHLQDFTMLEYYVAYWNYEDNMAFTEKMLVDVLQKLTGSLEFDVIGRDFETITRVDFTGPWPRVALRNLILEDSGIDIDTFPDAENLRKEIKKKKIDIQDIDKLGRGNLIDGLYKKVSRPKLIKPTFVIKQPTDQSPLARLNDDDPTVTDRFQLVVNTWEVVNAYSELVDPVDQADRFETQAADKAGGDEEAHGTDDDYIRAMEHGMPPMSGWGMGIDRIVALLTAQPNVRDVVLFPLMREEEKVD
ncbi:MAG: lysine--tRNA ligase [Candidatus Abawacabacteria bacterium RBG_16_42_10]|uniref:Lysine--tRNA ligase n=1 Tax=Candidatus Abawacabacteria bacterium RBG_16_42_10 TaxID=1817814 RepID=A0A1F4XLY9_9BACT|nr:MAG: lysine--tRNA ligase [Candidatus Abawacabacteria bacterium RBG_16_42_10]